MRIPPGTQPTFYFGCVNEHGLHYYWPEPVVPGTILINLSPENRFFVLADYHPTGPIDPARIQDLTIVSDDQNMSIDSWDFPIPALQSPYFHPSQREIEGLANRFFVSADAPSAGTINPSRERTRTTVFNDQNSQTPSYDEPVTAAQSPSSHSNQTPTEDVVYGPYLPTPSYLKGK